MVSEAMKGYVLKARSLWVMDWAGQSILAVSMTYWTTDVHAAIRAGPRHVAKYRDKCTSQIETIVTIVRGKLPTQTRITLGNEKGLLCYDFIFLMALYIGRNF